MFNKGCICW